MSPPAQAYKSPPTHPAPPKRRRRIGLIVTAAVAAVVLCAAGVAGALYWSTRPPVHYDIPSNFRGTWNGSGQYLDHHRTLQAFRIQLHLISGPPQWRGADLVGNVQLTADRAGESCGFSLFTVEDPQGHPDRVIVGPDSSSPQANPDHGGNDTGLLQLCNDVSKMTLLSDGTLKTEARSSTETSAAATNLAEDFWSVGAPLKQP